MRWPPLSVPLENVAGCSLAAESPGGVRRTDAIPGQHFSRRRPIPTIVLVKPRAKWCGNAARGSAAAILNAPGRAIRIASTKSSPADLLSARALLPARAKWSWSPWRSLRAGTSSWAQPTARWLLQPETDADQCRECDARGPIQQGCWAELSAPPPASAGTLVGSAELMVDPQCSARCAIRDTRAVGGERYHWISAEKQDRAKRTP